MKCYFLPMSRTEKNSDQGALPTELQGQTGAARENLLLSDLVAQ